MRMKNEPSYQNHQEEGHLMTLHFTHTHARGPKGEGKRKRRHHKRHKRERDRERKNSHAHARAGERETPPKKDEPPRANEQRSERTNEHAHKEQHKQKEEARTTGGHAPRWLCCFCCLRFGVLLIFFSFFFVLFCFGAVAHLSTHPATKPPEPPIQKDMHESFLVRVYIALLHIRNQSKSIIQSKPYPPSPLWY